MNGYTPMEIKELKVLIHQAKGLEQSVDDILKSGCNDVGKYASYRDMAGFYNDIAKKASSVIKCGSYYTFEIKNMKSWGDTVWPIAKGVLESVLVSTRMLVSTLEGNIDFIEVEVDNIENFIANKLRSVMYDKPSKEVEVQNALETLLIGKNLNKGLEYDRETGKFNFSGREYIPDFILPKLNTCIEVKLLKDKSKKSTIIEQINADITAYKKEYENVVFVIYDLGFIRDEVEFRRDIENIEGVKITIIKH